MYLVNKLSLSLVSSLVVPHLSIIQHLSCDDRPQAKSDITIAIAPTVCVCCGWPQVEERSVPAMARSVRPAAATTYAAASAIWRTTSDSYPAETSRSPTPRSPTPAGKPVSQSIDQELPK